MNGISRFNRAAAVLAGMTLVMLAAGCASDAGSRLKATPYRPVMTERSPWKWKAQPEAPEAGVPTTLAPTGTVVAALTSTNEAVVPPSSINTTDRAQKFIKRGDKLVIYMRDIPKPEDIVDVVDDKGNVNLPLVGPLNLAGKSTSEAEDTIEKTYINGGYYRKMNAIVVAQEDEYFVRDEVKRPDRYPLSRDMTLLQAITAAGGFTDFAKHSQVKILRGEEVLVFDADQIEERKDKDPLIKPGDIIVVPRRIWLR